MNVPWQIYLACADGESIDVGTYVALHTTIDLAGMFDIIEVKTVHQSWVRAATLNAREGAG